MEIDLVIRNGKLVTPQGVFDADVAVCGGKIAMLGENLKGKQEVDASGMLVLPGGVDPHVHLEMPAGDIRTSEDWASGTLAAACGGTTTVIDFVEPENGQSLSDAFASRCNQAEGNAAVDFGLHMTLTEMDAGNIDEIKKMVASGVPSFKLYTTYEGFAFDDAGLLRALDAIRQADGMALVHAENDAMLSWSLVGLVENGQLGIEKYAQSRPADAEAEAIQRVIRLTSILGTPVYFVHVSTAEGAAAISRAQYSGQAVYGETCPQYLVLDDSRYAVKDAVTAAGYVCAPPLRSITDQSGLWEFVANGTLQSIGTDHCAFNLNGQKDRGLGDFRCIPGGLPGIESRIPLMYSFGVMTGRITLQHWVSLCCEMPARIFGLFPRKGCLMPGADADIVLFDPRKTVEISNELLHEQVDYSPYAGFMVQGWPEKVFLRGELIVNNSHPVDRDADGCFQIRELHLDQIVSQN